MKKGIVFFVLFLFISMPFCIAEEINIPETFKAENVQVTSYFYTGEKLIASKNNNEINYYHVDRLGTTRLSTGTNPVIIGETKTLPFGEEIINENRFSFTGKELDEELYYFGARYYEPETGRFTSVDPIAENHDYIYVNNNPLNLIDPDGEEIDDPILMAQGFKDNKPANFVIDIIPVFGDAKGIGEGIVGYDSLGNKLAWWERGINFLGLGEFKAPVFALASFVPVLKARKVVESTQSSTDAAEGIVRNVVTRYEKVKGGVEEAVRRTILTRSIINNDPLLKRAASQIPAGRIQNKIDEMVKRISEGNVEALDTHTLTGADVIEARGHVHGGPRVFYRVERDNEGNTIYLIVAKAFKGNQDTVIKRLQELYPKTF